ncbi:hypothetical protein ACQ4M4_14305 [Leptolyngbya sp. AN02str]|uniref:hypothetical protein n=1 Tax=Leptolyngbya sp. AN02str TaxID=3423363 RepID=UPI003D31E594
MKRIPLLLASSLLAMVPVSDGLTQPSVCTDAVVSCMALPSRISSTAVGSSPIRVTGLIINRQRLGNHNFLRWGGTVTNVGRQTVFVEKLIVRVTRSDGRTSRVETTDITVWRHLSPGSSATIDYPISFESPMRITGFELLAVDAQW